MQQLLREQEIVMLPDNGGLLMPVLTPAKKLIGLLMIERLAEVERASDSNSLEAPARRPALQKAADGESFMRNLQQIWRTWHRAGQSYLVVSERDCASQRANLLVD